MTTTGPDVFYYNIVINNPGPGSIQANYSEQRDIPLIKDPREYYMSIIRFSVPGFSIPILIVPITNFPNTPYQTPYIITLTYNDTVVNQNVIYYSRSIDKNTILTPRSPYFYIWEYQHLIDLINNAFELAMATLIGLEPGLTGTPAPYLIYNSVTQLISLITQIGSPDVFTTPSANYNTLTPSYPADVININMDQQLFAFVQGMNTLYDDELSALTPYWMIIENTKNNFYTAPGVTGSYLQQTQQYNALNNWNSFTKLSFISKSLPTLKEFTPNVNFINEAGGVQSSSNTLPIITDFVPLLQFAGDQRADYIYTASNLYRIIELQSQEPLRSIDLQVVWNDQYNNQYPILLEPGGSIDIKFMFIKKDVYNKSKLII